MPDTAQIGRPAMRQEGDTWVAYYAQTGTMERALQLGSIRMTLIGGKPERKQAFMDLMRECVADMIEEITGMRPVWGGAQTAPEHERAGRG